MAIVTQHELLDEKKIAVDNQKEGKAENKIKGKREFYFSLPGGSEKIYLNKF